MRQLVRRSGILAFALVLASCADQTQLIVVVDSDLAVPSELDAVRVTVTGPAGQPMGATQSLAEDGGPMLPLTLGVRPAGEALGPVEILAEGMLDGATVVSRVARTTLVRGEARVLLIYLPRACRGVSCADGETCTENGCASPDVAFGDLPPWTGVIPRLDAGSDAGARDGGRSDGGADGGSPACTTGSDCDDGVDCTTDVCTDGACTHHPDDAACTVVAGGTCDAADGCQYPSCTEETCTAGPCQTAECVGDRCERTNLCESGEMCCAGECVAAGCDDGNACTDDACDDTSGCMHDDNTAGCDDSVYCNGADTCADGACSTHAGSPCSGSAVCDESMDRCTGCLSDADCGDPIYADWGPCGGFSDVCDISGTQTRSVTTFTCVSGTCMGAASTEDQSCSRDTNGTSCGTTTCDDWGSCGGYSNTCDESGTKSRTCTDHVCSAGTCGSSPRTESAGCTRDTDGTSCGTGSCTGWGPCGGFSDTCDESGTQSRTCTDPVCSSGSCGSDMRTETQGCTRDTDGVTCMASSCSSYSTCSGFTSTCDESGTHSRTCTDYACSAGSCAGSDHTESGSCSRDTEGVMCNDGLTCTFGDRCSGGSCSGGDTVCSPPCECTPSGCRNPLQPTMFCPL